MARIRTIKPQFFTSEDVTALAPLARLLFVGLFTECDRDGRVEDRPRTLKMRLLPEDDVDVDALLWSLVDGGLIRRYEAGGVNVIQVTGFQRHQKPHPKEADSLLPKDGTDRQKTHLNTASREQVINLPVENPSSPQCSLREGKEFQEGKGREGDGVSTPPSTPLISGESNPRTWGKIHGEHVAGFCDWVCLPEFIFAEFARKSAGRGDIYVLGWAKQVRGNWHDKAIGDNLKFWRTRWSESHPEVVNGSAPKDNSALMARLEKIERGEIKR